MAFSLTNYNERQREAITHDSGSILVISGAGTGKTNLLVGRILYLILEKGVSPDQILALTFTEKAAQEMTDRIDSELPLGMEAVWVKTFHAFCDAVLRESGLNIGLATDYKILKEVDLWIFLRRHLADFELDYFRSLGNPQRLLMAMQEYFSRLKDEDIKPEQYVEHARKMESAAKNDEEQEDAKKHLELAKSYGIYEKLLIENNYIDFGGLLFHTLRLFEKRASVLTQYQKRFKYILVDEFQDTNYAQNKIVTMLARRHRNLLVVGDDDQAIYKWRGASLTNIQYFQKEFAEARRVVLSDNYRNSQQILDMAYSVIQKNNPRRLESTENIEKKLVAAKEHKEKPTQIFHFENLADEVDFVVSSAIAALKKKLSPAILVRTNALATPFLEKLRNVGAPFQHFSPINLFTKAGIKDCFALLKVLANPWDDIAMFRFLSLPLWKIQMERILEITKRARVENRSLFDFVSGSTFENVKKILAELLEFSRKNEASKVIGKFLRDSGYLKDASQEIVEDIAMFSEKVREFEENHEHKQVMDFLNYAQMLEQVGQREIGSQIIDPSAIKLLTIHSAKGLEFDAVFVPGLAQWKFPGMDRKEAIEIPPELIPEPLPEGNHHLEEERRLFYVACTRARQDLILSYSDFYDGKKQWKPSIFVAEALESGKAILVDKVKKSKSSSRQTVLDFESRPHGQIKTPLPKLSYSQLDTFQMCPLKYKFRYISKITGEMPAVLNFGITMHNTLRDFYLLLQKDAKRFNENLMPVLREIYEKNWIIGGYETRAMQEIQKKHGFKILTKFYANEMKNPIIPSHIEVPFKLKIKDTIFDGRIDRIDRLPDGTYEVIDYKTGESQGKSLKNNLQLSVYALACRDVLQIPVSKLSLYLLETGEKISTERTDKSLDVCKDDILKLADEISSSDFSPTPGYVCSFCDYRLICPVAAPVVR